MTAYIVVVVVAFGAAVSGTVWAVFIFVRRSEVCDICTLLNDFLFITSILKSQVIPAI